MTHVKKEINDVDAMLQNSKIFNGNIVNTGIDKDTLSQLNMGYSADGQMTSGYSMAIEKLASSYKEATAEANALKMAQDGLSKSTISDILAKQNWSKVEREAAVQSEAFNAAQQKAAILSEANAQATWKEVAATKALNVAKKLGSFAGNILLSTAISAGISLLINGIVTVVDNIHTSEKEIKEAAETARQEIDDIKSSFDELENTTNNIKNRYAELAQSVDLSTLENLSLSTEDYEEFLRLNSQLAELFPTLTKNYDENGNAIFNLSGDVDSIVASLDRLIKTERQLANEEILENMPNIYKDYRNELANYTKELEKAKQKQEEYNQLYHQLKNAQYDVSNDKKIVTFHFGNIDEEEKAKLAQELTSSFEDINDYVVQDIGTLDNHDTTITLYLDEEFKGFEARLKSAQDDIAKYTSKIKSEVSSFSTYMNTWLQNSWEYQKQDDHNLQQAIQQVLFNKDWIKLAEDELGENAKWEQITSWIEENYIAAINQIEDESIKQDFIDLFTLEGLTPQEQIDLAKKIQEHFDKYEIAVSLDFILNSDDQNSTQNLVDRFNNSISQIAAYDPEGYLKLKEETKDFDQNQMAYWLEVTQGIVGADNALMALENSLKTVSEDNNFFTEDNIESIDEYKNAISDLSGYLEILNSGEELTAEDLSKLNIEYGIFANSADEYNKLIINKMDELSQNSTIMQALSEAIDNCSDAAKRNRLQSLYDALNKLHTEAKQSVESMYDLEEIVGSLKSSAALLRELDENIKEFGLIAPSQADEIINTFPEMAEQVAKYNAGLITAEQLFNSLVNAYKADTKNYGKALAEKLKYDEEYYDRFVDNLPDWVQNLASSYDIDLKNYKTLHEQKEAMDIAFANRLASLNASTSAALGGNRRVNFSDKPVYDDQEQEQVYQDQKKLETALQSAIYIPEKIDWETFGLETEDKDENEKSMSDIDWLTQSLEVLQNTVDDAQESLENTHGYKKQIQAIDELNNALQQLRQGYNLAKKEYSDRYTESLSQLSNGETIRHYIESGTKFDLSSYDSDTAGIIQNAIDAYNSMLDAEEKAGELNKQIKDNNNLEKSKINQQKYEAQLEVVNTKLEDQTLSTNKKNKLLTKQYNLQIKINEELRKQAKYTKDSKEVARLDAEDKNKEYQYKIDAYTNNKEKRGFYINDIQNNIQDIQHDIESKGGRGTKEQYKQMISLNKETKDYWKKQKSDAKDMLSLYDEGTAAWDHWNNEIQECENNIADCNENIKAARVSILQLPLNNVQDALKEIENHLEIINDSLDDHNVYISAATSILDQEIESQNILKEATQDQIDALEKTNELRQVNLQLQQAEYALRRAEEQRSSKVFKEGQGWVYESDPDEINNAQQQYDEALYNKKIYLLNQQIDIYDEEIERLNKIKENWSRITSDAQLIIDISSALAYDGDFINKVLAEDIDLLKNISNEYSNLLTQKTLYETQQEDYTSLQDVINDTVEVYQLEGITYKEAKQRISNAIKQYYPEIVSNYKNEAETLERVAEKKLEDAGVTEETSETITEDIKGANAQIIDSYANLKVGLSAVFDELNTMISDYAANAQNMAESVKKSINTITNQLNSLPDSTVDKIGLKVGIGTLLNEEITNVGKSHNGMELGYLGESSISNSKEAFRCIALDELGNSELLRLVQKGEAILTPNQVDTVMTNFRNLSQVKVPTLLSNNQPVQSVEFKGDIVIQNPVGDSSKLAKEIRQNLSNAVLQELYKK